MPKVIVLVATFLLINVCALPTFTHQLTKPRFYISSTTVNNLALFAGGIAEDESNLMDIYNDDNRLWSSTTLPKAKHGMGASSYKNLAFFGGGYSSNEDKYMDSVDIYDTLTGNWTNEYLSEPRAFPGCAVLKDLIFFAGGGDDFLALNDPFYNVTDVVDILNITSRTWTTARLSHPRIYISAISVRDIVLFAGGFDGVLPVTRVDIYNVTSNTWSTAELSQARDSISSTVLNDLVLFSGGVRENIGQATDRVDILNVTDMTWSQTTLASPRTVSASVTVGHFAIIAGGTIDNMDVQIVEMFDYETKQWKTDLLSIGRIWTAGAAVGNKAIFAGGASAAYGGAVPIADIFEICDIDDTCQDENVCNGQETCSNSICHVMNVTTCDRVSDLHVRNVAAFLAPIIVLTFIIGLTFAIWVWRNASQHPKASIDLEMSPVPENDSVSEIGTVSDIDIGAKLGSGHFGDVYKALWQKTTTVACKKPKSMEGWEEIRRESEMLGALSHRNVVQFYGIYVAGNNQYLVTEYMNAGSLDALLTEQMEAISVGDLMMMARDAAAGMLYLNSQGIAHCDLALRNLLVSRSMDPERKEIKYTVKISDFGLSKMIQVNNYYTVKNKQNLPVKWCAPEVLEYGKFSLQSDIWSFGIMLWELFSFGKKPYYAFSNEETITKVLGGYRMEKPANCSDDIYQMMLQCWKYNSADRPGFKEILDKFTNFHTVYTEDPKTCSSSPEDSAYVTITDEDIL